MVTPFRFWSRFIILLLFLLALGSCGFFALSAFPPWLTYAQSRLDIRKILDQHEIRDASIQAYYANLVIGTDDYSRVLVAIQGQTKNNTEQKRLIMVLDPDTLIPALVLDNAKLHEIWDDSDPWEIFPIGDIPQGFLFGNFVIDPENLEQIITHDNDLSSYGQSGNGFRVAGLADYGESGGKSIWLPTSGEIELPFYVLDLDAGVPVSYSMSWSETNPPGMRVDDVHWDHRTDELKLLVLLQDSTTGVLSYTLVTFDNGGENLFTQPESIGLSADDIQQLEVQPFLDDQFRGWITQDGILVRTDYRELTRFNFSGEKIRTIQLGDSRIEVLGFDPGYDGSRWWLLYDRESGYLYKNRVWW